MDQDRPDLPEDFSDIERRLDAARPSFSELELDQIKLRAVAKASRPRRTGGQLKGIALRSRVLRIAVSLVAFAGTAAGGVAAFDVLANASTSQYGTSSCQSNGGFLVVNGPAAGTTASTSALGPYTVTLETCAGVATTPNALTGASVAGSMPVSISCSTTAPTPLNDGGGCPGNSYFGTTASNGATGAFTVNIPDNASTSGYFYFDNDTAGGDGIVASSPGSGQTYFPNANSGYEAVVLSGQPTKLVFTTQPTSGQNIQAKGTGSFNVSVSVEDAAGNVVTSNSSASVTLKIFNGTGTLSCATGLAVTAQNGVAAFTGCAMTAAGAAYKLTATSTPSYTVPTNANSFNITAGALASFTATSPGTQTAGTAFNVAITAADDANGNPVSGAQTIGWSGPANSPAPVSQAPLYPSTATSVTLTSGAGSATGIKLYDAATGVTLKATDGTITSTTGTFTVNAGALASFTATSPGNQTAGTAFNVALSAADDAYSNPISGAQTIGWSGPSNSPAPSNKAPLYPTTATSVTFTNGAGSAAGINLYDAATGVTLKATDGTITSTTGTFTVSAGTLASFTATSPGTQTAGTAFNVALSAADDAYSNPISGAQTIGWSGPANSPAPVSQAPLYPSTATSVTFTNGAGSATGIKLYDATTGVTLKATDGTITSTTASFAVNSIAGGALTFSPSGTVTIGTFGSNQTFTVEIPLDAYSNPFISTTPLSVTVKLTGNDAGDFQFSNSSQTQTLTITSGPAANTATVTSETFNGGRTATLSGTVSAPFTFTATDTVKS